MIVKAVDVDLDEHYFHWLHSRGERSSYSEVVMILPRPGDRVLTLTKSFYPEGTYNLPSGGIEPGETPELAFAREVSEETGLSVNLVGQIGRIEHHCLFDQSSLDFVSHVMLGTQTQEPAHAADPDESISGYIDASASDLARFSAHMRRMTGRWAGFGKFRATALDFAADWLERRLGERP